MFGTLKRLSFAVMLLSGIVSIFTTLGTLNNRLQGGFTLQNLPWAAAVGTFAFSVILSFVLKVLGPIFDEQKALH